MVEAEAVCRVVEATGEILCTVSLASISAVLMLALIGMAIQAHAVIEDWKK